MARHSRKPEEKDRDKMHDESLIRDDQEKYGLDDEEFEDIEGDDSDEDEFDGSR